MTELTLECEECGREFEPVTDRNDLCGSCKEAKALDQIEAPEGGWERGSTMDRI